MRFIVSLLGSRETLQQRLGTFASVVVLVLMVGAIIIVFSIAQHGGRTVYSTNNTGDGVKCMQSPGMNTIFASAAGHLDQAGLYVADGESLYHLAVQGGSLQPSWRFKLDTCFVRQETPVPGLKNEGIVYPSISNVVVADGLVYFSGRERDRSYLYALRATDGALSWRKESSNSGLLFLNGLIYTETSANANENAILALDGRNGSTRWSYHYPSNPIDQAHGLETVGDGKVYVSTANTLFALDAASGKRLWSRQVEDQQTFDAARFFDGVVYATSASTCFNCEVEAASSLAYAFDPASGKQLWQSKRVAGYLSPPAEVQGVVYFGSQDGTVYALHAQDGTQIWRGKVGGEVRTLPRVNNGVCCMLELDIFKLYPIQIVTHGNQIWSYVTTGEYDGYEDISVGSGTVYVAGQSTSIDIVRASNGVLLQSYNLQIDYPNSFIQVLVS